MREHLTRAPVLLGALWLFACVGPGLEPPGEGRGSNDSNGPNAMGAAGSAGTGAGTGAAGTAAGLGAPDGSAGVTTVAGTGGFSGHAGGAGAAAAGVGAAGMGAQAGAGGASGTGVPSAGSGAMGDAGMDEDPTAPPQDECEQGRDRVELAPTEQGAAPSCTLSLPEAARGYAPLAITLALTDDSGTTTPDQVSDASACEPDGSGFYYVPGGASTALIAQPGNPVIVLCQGTCDEASGDVTIEVLYGCEPPRR